MGIGVVVQAKMALVFRLVHRLAQRAQQHGLDDMRVRPVLHLLQ